MLFQIVLADKNPELPVHRIRILNTQQEGILLFAYLVTSYPATYQATSEPTRIKVLASEDTLEVLPV